jgi:hypothetical protein
VTTHGLNQYPFGVFGRNSIATDGTEFSKAVKISVPGFFLCTLGVLCGCVRLSKRQE